MRKEQCDSYIASKTKAIIVEVLKSQKGCLFLYISRSLEIMFDAKEEDYTISEVLYRIQRMQGATRLAYMSGVLTGKEYDKWKAANFSWIKFWINNCHKPVPKHFKQLIKRKYK